MTEQTLRILQVSTSDTMGGAERVAWSLFETYRRRGHHSWLAVGHKFRHDPDVLLIPNSTQPGSWARFCQDIHSRLKSLEAQQKWISRLANLFSLLAEPGRGLDQYRGIEDFRFAGTWKLLQLNQYLPDILHCHNLHGSYFDLRALPWLTRQVPLVLTLHDAWLLSGHCAHSFGCERWQIGCGHCPDLTIDPPIQRDATAYNWQRKRRIYAQSRIYVSTPSRWLMQKVERSMLAPAVTEARVIPNGIDLTLFHPGDKQAVRSELDIPQEAAVLLFTANKVRGNKWKDYQTIRAAITLVSESLHGQDVLLIALGEDAPAERIGKVELRFIPYQKDPAIVARYYQAADVYVHAARADTFPNTILEALACGLPVVATSVGGIPEQVEDGQTGFLVPPGDAHGMSECIHELLSNDNLRECLSAQAAESARRRFDLQQQADSYLAWYRELAHSSGSRFSERNMRALSTS